MSITIGIDPGFANIGVAVVDATNSGLVVKSMRVFCTKKCANTKYVADDNLRRAKDIYSFFIDLITHWRADGLVVERMTYPRNASTAAKTAMFWGVLVSISEELDLPIVSISSQQVKKHICGDRTASKNDIIKALNDKFKIVTEVPKTKQEHCYDALANVITVIEDEKLEVSIC